MLSYLFELLLVLTTSLDGWVGGWVAGWVGGWVGGFGGMETKTNLSQS